MRISSLLAAGALVLASLTAVGGAAAPAQADDLCQVTYSVAGGKIHPKPADAAHSWNPFVIEVEDPRTVVDINWSIDITHPAVNNISAHLLGPKTGDNLTPTSQGINMNDASGRVDGLYAFDDEAGTRTFQGSGANPAPGTYVPWSKAALLEGGTGTGSWSVWILNNGPATGQLRSFSVSLTYDHCDTDQDGVEEKVDNCPFAANPDQLDTDGDGRGNVCDDDDDGDVLGDVADRCPLLAATTPSGCPPVSRSLKLTPGKRKARGKLIATLRSDAPACTTGAKLTLHRARKGKDPKVATLTTRKNGKATTRKPRRPGMYYLKVASHLVDGAAQCSADRSNKLRIRR